jgi:hypothetical protein
VKREALQKTTGARPRRNESPVHAAKRSDGANVAMLQRNVNRIVRGMEIL